MGLINRLIAVIAFCAFAGRGAALPAAAAASGYIEGTVIDAASHVPLANAAVRVAAGSNATIALTESSGRYALELAASSYEFSVSKLGYQSVGPRLVVVEEGKTVTADVALTKNIQTLGAVAVKGRAGELIGIASSAAAGVVGPKDLPAGRERFGRLQRPTRLPRDPQNPTHARSLQRLWCASQRHRLLLHLSPARRVDRGRRRRPLPPGFPAVVPPEPFFKSLGAGSAPARRSAQIVLRTIINTAPVLEDLRADN